MLTWDCCIFCGRKIPVGEPCFGIVRDKTLGMGQGPICRDCIRLENASSDNIDNFPEALLAENAQLRKELSSLKEAWYMYGNKDGISTAFEERDKLLTALHMFSIDISEINSKVSEITSAFKAILQDSTKSQKNREKRN